MVDAGDATGNTVWAGGVDGGLWKTTSITSTPAGWSVVSDKFANLAITSICQDPKRPDTIYFCTGEANFNFDAVQGDGIFRSMDGGLTWAQLSSTTSVNSSGAFNFCSKILCDTSGNVYVGTRTGLKRSVNQGTSWTDITPSSTGGSPYIGDINISSTGRMHVTVGQTFTTTAYYRYTNNPATVTSATWTSANTPPPGPYTTRLILASKGDTLIALPADTNYEVLDVYSSTDGGDTWSATPNTPSFTSGQGWYCLAAAINPSNGKQYLIGSLDCHRSTDAGTNWSQVSVWVGGGFSYVHADQHQAIWYTAGAQSRVLVMSDGGVFLSTNGGTTFTDRNEGLRIKQFFSCAINPDINNYPNYLLGGAQDNGCHKFNPAGLGTSEQTTGGDGAFVHIDQNEPKYQFGSYVFNQYRRSTDSGKTWSSVNLSSTQGQFINPTDYDHTSNIMYCSNSAGSYRRWTNPQTGSTNAVVNITGFNSSNVFAVAVSPYTTNTVLFGTQGGRVVRVASANTIASGSAGTVVGTLSGNISSITYGGSDDTVIVTTSTYSSAGGVAQVWYTTNATAATPTWTSKDGNLPNIPARWSLILPGFQGKRVIVATETGVWYTDDISAASVVWLPDLTFPNVRTDMLKYRASDGTVAAATHGRGMWTANASLLFAIVLPVFDFTLNGKVEGKDVTLTWTYNTVRNAVKFDVERSTDGVNFKSVYTTNAINGRQNYNYTDESPLDGRIYYRIKSYDEMGLTHYSNTAMLSMAATSDFALNAYPSPFHDNMSLSVNAPREAKMSIQVWSVTGAKVYDRQQQVSAGSQVFPLNLSNLAPGNYYVTAVVNGMRYWKLVVKQ
jgi:hypothetical protein